jgi:hypothetical protein
LVPAEVPGKLQGQLGPKKSKEAVADGARELLNENIARDDARAAMLIPAMTSGAIN